MSILQALLICFFPYLAVRLTKKFANINWLNPVVLCYGFGILLANTPLLANTDIPHHFSQATILFAMPLLLFNTDLKAWLGYARSTILSFILCVISGLIAAGIMAFVYKDTLPDTWRLSGMMVGIFTGGIPNMQAIGMALSTEESTYILINAADILCGGIYLLFLTSVAHRLFGYFLPTFQNDKTTIQTTNTASPSFHAKTFYQALGLTLIIIGLSVGITYLLMGNLKRVSLLILLLTTCSVLASFVPKIRAWSGTFEMGEYFLLMFCVAVGMLANLQEVFQKGLWMVAYMGSIWLLLVVLHLLFCYWFKIDRDTAIITSTAAIYGPVFIGQVASAINNKQLVFSGMVTGLVGYAIGNYLGIGIANLLRIWVA